MAKITVSNLNPAGSNLFEDSESFLNELTEQDTTSVKGGLPIRCSGCNCPVRTIAVVFV